MKKLILIILIFNVALLITAQPTVKWSKEYISDASGIGGSIYTDLKGNAYGECNYNGLSVHIGGSTTYSSTGYYKPLLIYGVDTSNGSPTWVSEIKPMAGCGCNYGARSTNLTTDNTGNLLVAGYFCNCGTMAFSTQTLSALSHQTFLAKYSKTGQLLWVKTKADMNNGMTSADYHINAITTDELDNIYISLSSKLNANFAGLTIDKGEYIIKLNGNGIGMWAKQTYNANTPNNGLSVKKIQYLNSKLYASSVFIGNTNIDGHSFSSINSTVDVALLKFDTTSTLLNKLIISSSEEDYEFNLQLLPNTSLVFIGQAYNISGTSSALISVGTNTYSTINTQSKYYFVKLDTNLNVTTYKNFGGTNYINPYLVSSDLNNTMYLTIGNSTVNNVIDGVTIANTGPNILTIDNNLNVTNAFKSASYYVCADKDANLYTTTSSASVTINAFNTSFSPSGPQPWSQFMVKLGPLVTGIDNNGNKTSTIKIYPNPTNSILNIVNEHNQLQNATIEIKNYLGQVVFTTPFTSQINLQNLSAGMYFLTLQDKSSSKTVKFIKR
ncbi:MAG: T9SS type A sorting domain-containing protein [Bacteroidia bacterium]|nr:T9SS type A sorting domain-containing protein [Bacteroidia bacterium]